VTVQEVLAMEEVPLGDGRTLILENS
jgi:hypothetical protein